MLRIGAEKVEITCDAGQGGKRRGNDPAVHHRGQRAFLVAVDEACDEQRHGDQQAGDLNVPDRLLIVLLDVRLAGADKAEQQEPAEQQDQEHEPLWNLQPEEH